MRYGRKQALWTLLLTGITAGALFGQQATEKARRPGLMTRVVSALSLEEDAPGVLPATNATSSRSWSGQETGHQLPQADNDGSVSGSTLAERMKSIRRRAVDASISRPFSAQDSGSFQAEADNLNGALPAVKRRPLGPIPTPQLPGQTSGSTRRAVPVTQQPEPEPPATMPQIADTPQETPTPAVEIADMPSGPAPIATTPIEVRPMPTYSSTPSPEPTPATPEPAEEVLLTHEAPAISFRTSGPRKITIGKEAAYKITMLNQSQVDAEKVICTVTLPPWAEIVGNSSSVGAPRVEIDDNQNNIVRWEIPKIAASNNESLALNIVPRDGRPFDLAVGWAFAPDHSMALIEVQEPKLEIALNGSEEVDYGDTQKYSITISNPGTGDAENVVLNLMPMAGQQPVAGSRNLGNIAAGERKTIELELTAHQAGRLQVKAMAHADNGLRAEAAQEVLVRRANLDVVVMGPPRNYAATTATYKVRMENTGDSMAENAIASASLPAGANYINSTDGGKYDPKRAQVEWHVGALRPGSIRVLELQCELNSSGENRLDVQCQSSQEINVTKSVVTLVEALADLKLYVNDPQGAVPIGEESEYEVRVVNRGTKAAENIQLVGYFSDGVEPEAVQGGRGQVGTGQVVFDPISSIKPGKELIYRITARASQPGNHVFRAELQCRAPETRLATEEWTKYYRGEAAEETDHEVPGTIELE